MWVGDIICCVISFYKWWSLQSPDVLNVGVVFPYLAALASLTLGTNVVTTGKSSSYVSVYLTQSFTCLFDRFDGVAYLDRRSHSNPERRTSFIHVRDIHELFPQLPFAEVRQDYHWLCTPIHLICLYIRATYIAQSNSSYIVSAAVRLASQNCFSSKSNFIE